MRPSVMVTNPTSTTLRRPTMSARRPTAMMGAANNSRYPLITHKSELVDALRSSPILGRATVSPKKSRVSRTMTPDMATTTSHLRLSVVSILLLGPAAGAAGTHAAGDLRGQAVGRRALFRPAEDPQWRPADALQPAGAQGLPSELVVALEGGVHFVGGHSAAGVGDVHDAAGQVDSGTEVVALARKHRADGEPDAHVGQRLVVGVGLGHAQGDAGARGRVLGDEHDLVAEHLV